MYDSTIDLLGYLAAGFLWFMLMRKKFLFVIAQSLVLASLMGVIISNLLPKESHMLVNLIFTCLSQFNVAIAYQGMFYVISILPSIF